MKSFLTSLKGKIDNYKEENKSLFKRIRDSLLAKLEKIKEFFIRQKNQIFNEKRNLNRKNISLICIIIKVFWVILASLYLIGVFEIMTIVNRI